MDPSVNDDQTNTTPNGDGSSSGVTPVTPADDTNTPTVDNTGFGSEQEETPKTDPVSWTADEPVTPPATDTPEPGDAPVPNPNEASEVSAKTDQPEAPVGGAF